MLRDIKPANIYLCRLPGELDVAKVLDFGMVRQVQTAEEQRLTMAGTVEDPLHGAEQIRNAVDVDGRADCTP